MRTREKQRIFKRFMDGECISKMGHELYFKQNPRGNGQSGWRLTMCVEQVEQAIRDVVATKIEFYESWTGAKK
jgi:sarcosine oxidase delta subunit